jgi:DNA repair exonuclease SbcCD ATPase subunit
MSEKKTKSQELQEQIESQNKKIESLTTLLEELKAAKETESHVHHDPPPHASAPLAGSQPQQEPKKPESGLEHYRNCPTCHKAINEEAKKELAPDIEKETAVKLREKVKSLKNPVICENCGDVIDREESSCPTCHGTKARKFSS